MAAVAGHGRDGGQTNEWPVPALARELKARMYVARNISPLPERRSLHPAGLCLGPVQNVGFRPKRLNITMLTVTYAVVSISEMDDWFTPPRP